MPRTRAVRKTTLFLVLLLLIFHWLFISPVIRNYRTRIPTPDAWPRGEDVLTLVPSLNGVAVAAPRAIRLHIS